MFWLIESQLGKCYIQDGLYCISIFLLKKSYKQLEIDNVNTVSSFGKDISCPYVGGKRMHRCPKTCFQQFFRLDLVLNLFSIFHQIPGSCSYKNSVSDHVVLAPFHEFLPSCHRISGYFELAAHSMRIGLLFSKTMKRPLICTWHPIKDATFNTIFYDGGLCFTS